jgi:hypothetical protein
VVSERERVQRRTTDYTRAAASPTTQHQQHQQSNHQQPQPQQQAGPAPRVLFAYDPRRVFARLGDLMRAADALLGQLQPGAVAANQALFGAPALPLPVCTA